MTIGVIAHRKRITAAAILADFVNADITSVDDGTLGCNQNHYTVLKALSATPSTWTVILEDDALPVAGFTTQLTQALPLAPSPIVSFYLGRQRPTWAQTGIAEATTKATATDAHWIISTHLLHAVGYAIKTPLIPDMLRFPTPLPVDQHISRWAQTLGHTIAYTWPSLIDHADTDTLVNHPDGQPRTPGRVAWNTSPHHDWTTRSVTLRTSNDPS